MGPLCIISITSLETRPRRKSIYFVLYCSRFKGMFFSILVDVRLRSLQCSTQNYLFVSDPTYGRRKYFFSQISSFFSIFMGVHRSCMMEAPPGGGVPNHAITQIIFRFRFVYILFLLIQFLWKYVCTIEKFSTRKKKYTGTDILHLGAQPGGCSKLLVGKVMTQDFRTIFRFNKVFSVFLRKSPILVTGNEHRQYTNQNKLTSDDKRRQFWPIIKQSF